jgi:uncharacterized protein
MRQEWHNLLFADWPVPISSVRGLVPEQLELDTWDGVAWISVTPFILHRLRTKGCPPMPGLSRFPTIAVRTYVRVGDKPGLYYLSLDAASRTSITVGRIVFGFPLYFAWADHERILDGVDFRSTRDDRRGDLATFRAQYRPSSEVFRAAPGSYEWYIAERYCVYTVDRHDKVWRTEIDHIPWPLQTAEFDIRTNTMADAVGISLPNYGPLTYFCRYLDVRVWRPIEVDEAEYS